MAFSFSFIGTFVSLAVLLGSLFSASPTAPIALLSGFLFFLLLGVKNVVMVRRFPVFFSLVYAMSFIAVWGFFSGIISLPVLALIVFLVCRDAFASFTPFPGRTSLLAAIAALFIAEMSWAVFYLNIPVGWASVAVFMAFSGVLYAIVKYLRGALFKSNAPFIATALGIASASLLLLVSF
jgi:hypothetical protein